MDKNQKLELSKIKEEKEVDSDDSYEGVINDIQKNVEKIKLS